MSGRSILPDLKALDAALQKVPHSYVESVLNDDIDPDDRTVAYNSQEQGGYQVLGSLGTIRAMTRVVQILKKYQGLLLEDEGPWVTLPMSTIREAVLRLSHEMVNAMRDGFKEIPDILKPTGKPGQEMIRVADLRTGLDAIFAELEMSINAAGQIATSQTREVRSCVGCGCTDLQACEGGCYWVGPNLCSRCQPTQPAAG